MNRPKPNVDVSEYFIPSEAIPERFSWPELFGNEAPTEIEVGPGKGLFLQMAAAANPQRNYLGIEIAKKYATMAAQRAAKHQLHNVRLIAGDARLLLEQRVDDQTLEGVHVYFPDPWWKKRHHKRRVFSTAFINQVARVVRTGGFLSVATDVEGYAEQIFEKLTEHPAFNRTTVPDDPQDEPTHNGQPITNFERKYRIEGRSIHRARFLIQASTV